VLVCSLALIGAGRWGGQHAGSVAQLLASAQVATVFGGFAVLLGYEAVRVCRELMEGLPRQPRWVLSAAIPALLAIIVSHVAPLPVLTQRVYSLWVTGMDEQTMTLREKELVAVTPAVAWWEWLAVFAAFLVIAAVARLWRRIGRERSRAAASLRS